MSARHPKKQYRVTYRCRICNCRYEAIVAINKMDAPAPPCPNLDCGQAEPLRPTFVKQNLELVHDRGFDPSDGKAPGYIGNSNLTKAIDITGEIVMRDQQMTDIRIPEVHEGENSAPKLPHAMQQQVDGFWGGNNAKRAGMKTTGRNLAVAAMGGAFSNAALGSAQPDIIGDVLHKPRLSVPTTLIKDPGKG